MTKTIMLHKITEIASAVKEQNTALAKRRITLFKKEVQSSILIVLLEHIYKSLDTEVFNIIIMLRKLYRSIDNAIKIDNEVYIYSTVHKIFVGITSGKIIKRADLPAARKTSHINY